MPRFTSVVLRRIFVLFALMAPIADGAQAAPSAFELNMDRVKVASFGGSLLSPSKVYFIPAVNLMVSASGSVWAQSKVGDANAKAHAKFFVKGLDKALLQNLARQIQEDLVSKMRAAGYTILTYEDLKTHPTISGHGRDTPDSNWGLPTMKKDPLTYLIATPTDEQAFDRPITGPVFWLKNIAKEKDLVVLVPDITLNVPTVYGESGGGYKRAEATVSIKPAMRMMGAMIWTTNGKGGTANIQVLEHGTRLVAEEAGAAKKVSEDKMNINSAWGTTSADYVFTLDQAVFSDGVLRVGSQINAMIVSQIAKAKK